MAGYIKKLGKNYYSLFVEAGKSPTTGKRHRIYRAFRGTQSEARIELARLETELAQGTFLEPAKMTVAEYLRWWLEQHSQSATKEFSPATIQSYRARIEAHLIPALGGISLDKLNAIHIQNYIVQAKKTGQKPKKKLKKGEKTQFKPFSPRTINYSLVVLRLALKHAVKKYKLIKENPAELLDIVAKTAKKQRVLKPEDMRKVLAKASTREYNLITFALFTGMRRGEILGLRWTEIDMDKRILKVIRSLLRVIGRGLVFRNPKTEAGVRKIDLSSTTVPLLQEIHRTQAKNKLLLGPDYQNHDLVFCLPDGRPIDPDNMSRHFHTTAIEADFPTLRFHDLRHMFASWMLADGEELHVVQELLGHEKASTTEDEYTEAMPGSHRLAVDRFDEKYGNLIISAGPGQARV
jgi:integrase